jgi:hypothetical protein
MENVNQRVTKLMLAGIILAVILKFVLYFVARSIDGQFLSYGYLAKGLLWCWLLCMYLYSVKIEKQKFLLWKDRKYSFPVIALSVIVIVGLVLLSNVIPVLFGLKKEHSQLLEAMTAYLKHRPVLLILSCITAGVVEEMIFRGYLIPRFEILFRNGFWAVIVSALLFGLAHYQYGTISNIIFPLAVGLIFGFYYLKYKNLKVLIIIHFFIDLFSLSHLAI